MVDATGHATRWSSLSAAPAPWQPAVGAFIVNKRWRGSARPCVFVLPQGERAVNEPVWLELSAQGRLLGEVTREPIGRGGFGYDPIFYVPELGCTAAELTREEKIAISHRGKALKLMLEAMRNAS